MAELLACDAYTSQSGTPAKKKGVLDRWTQTAGQPFIVATSALAEGFDYAHVRLVVHVNEPKSLVLFAQESGRAGRDDARAYSLVLLPTTWEVQGKIEIDRLRMSNLHHDGSLRKHHERGAVHRYLRGEQCYRTSLTEHLDVGSDRRWCMTEDVPCDVCQRSHEEAVPRREVVAVPDEHTGLDLMLQEKVRTQSEFTRYRQHLHAVQGICLLCRALDEGWDHEFGRCGRRYQVFEERSKARRRHEAMGRTWLPPFSVCFWCFHPQSICPRAAGRGKEERKGCEHGDQVLPLCYGIYVGVHGASWLLDNFERSFASIEQYFDWLGEGCTFGGGSAIQAVRVAAKALCEFEL